MQIAPAGDRASLVTMPEASPAELQAYAEAMRTRDGVDACVVGYESVLVLGGGAHAAALGSGKVAARTGPSRHHRIVVSFRDEYAPDLTIPRQELFAPLPLLTVRFLGFRPGFAYLDGWPERWRLPRRPTSRNRVPRGSFAVAGAFAGFYAVDSPGGWNLLGRTAAPLWQPRRDPPNLLAPGDEIEIVPTMEPIELPLLDDVPAVSPAEGVADVLSAGQFTTIVGAPDLKRLEHGLPTGGPFDPELAAATNRAAGNDDHAPLFECVLVGPRLRFRVAARVAWNGRGFDVRAGEEIDVGRFRDVFRGYLAVSRGEGGKSGGGELSTSDVGAVRRGPGLRNVIDVVRGPHDFEFADAEWEVTPQLDRVGVRLRPLAAPPARPIPADLPSIGVQFGSVQWHPDGSLILMGPDHPVTGGYLQPVTVVWSERWKIAQLAPGERVRLRPV